MITLYTGTPGSGKSLHSAKKIFETLLYQKINVIGNFEINRDVVFYKYKDLKKFKKGKKIKLKKRKTGKYFYFDNEYLTVDLLIKFAKKHHEQEKENQC